MQILFTSGPNTTQEQGQSICRPPAGYADCELHKTGGLGPEALVTFLLSSFVYVIMPFEANTSWFSIKCRQCAHTSSFPRDFPRVPLISRSEL